jgi:hypothetical protein
MTMSDHQWNQFVNASKVALAFLNAVAATVAGYPGADLSPLMRLMAVAISAGCGAALLMLQPPGRKSADGITVSAVADELERRNRRRQQAVRQEPTA